LEKISVSGIVFGKGTLLRRHISIILIMNLEIEQSIIKETIIAGIGSAIF
jgi:hypothetical protein